MGSLSIWHWLIVLLIVVLVFGTRKLPNVAKDLGSAIKGFKEGLREGGAAEDKSAQQKVGDSQQVGTIDVQAKEKSGS